MTNQTLIAEPTSSPAFKVANLKKETALHSPWPTALAKAARNGMKKMACIGHYLHQEVVALSTGHGLELDIGKGVATLTCCAMHELIQ